MTRRSIATSIRVLLYIAIIGLVIGVARWSGAHWLDEPIVSGQTVPPPATGTPTSTPTQTPSSTPSSTPTATPTASSTPTQTPTPTPRSNPTATPTPGPEPTPGSGFPVPGRGNTPLILRGQQVEQFLGTPLDQFGAYIVGDNASEWQPVPFQIDEVNAAGDYATVDDGVLGARDEIAVMLRDLGRQRTDAALTPAQVPEMQDWYEIEVVDPLAETGTTGWLYLVRFSQPQAAPATDYLEFDHGFHRITNDVYTLGLGVTNAGADYLRLTNGPEILDRIKMYIECTTPFVCPQTEEARPDLADGLVKDGPVRLILRNGDLLAYDTMLQWTTIFTTTQGPARFSFDFTPQITGAKYYNANERRGVTVDGRPDLVQRVPFSPWWQVSTAYGTLIFVSDLSGDESAWRTYYKDDSDYDATDTGDRQHFGDAGIMTEADVLDYTYTFTLYFVPGRQRTIGRLFADLPTTPVSVSTNYRQPWPPGKGFLPILRR